MLILFVTNAQNVNLLMLLARFYLVHILKVIFFQCHGHECSVKPQTPMCCSKGHKLLRTSLTHLKSVNEKYAAGFKCATCSQLVPFSARSVVRHCPEVPNR